MAAPAASRSGDRPGATSANEARCRPICRSATAGRGRDAPPSIWALLRPIYTDILFDFHRPPRSAGQRAGNARRPIAAFYNGHRQSVNVFRLAEQTRVKGEQTGQCNWRAHVNRRNKTQLEPGSAAAGVADDFGAGRAGENGPSTRPDESLRLR